MNHGASAQTASGSSPNDVALEVVILRGQLTISSPGAARSHRTWRARRSDGTETARTNLRQKSGSLTGAQCGRGASRSSSGPGQKSGLYARHFAYCSGLPITRRASFVVSQRNCHDACVVLLRRPVDGVKIARFPRGLRLNAAYSVPVIGRRSPSSVASSTYLARTVSSLPLSVQQVTLRTRAPSRSARIGTRFGRRSKVWRAHHFLQHQPPIRGSLAVAAHPHPPPGLKSSAWGLSSVCCNRAPCAHIHHQVSACAAKRSDPPVLVGRHRLRG